MHLSIREDGNKRSFTKNLQSFDELFSKSIAKKEKI